MQEPKYHPSTYFHLLHGSNQHVVSGSMPSMNARNAMFELLPPLKMCAQAVHDTLLRLSEGVTSHPLGIAHMVKSQATNQTTLRIAPWGPHGGHLHDPLLHAPLAPLLWQ